jgi:hypothetical protein
MDKEGSILLIDDNQAAEKMIDRLLKNKVDVFDDFQSYKMKYPGINAEERLKRQKEWIENARKNNT